jgi:hypothetical protein
MRSVGCYYVLRDLLHHFFNGDLFVVVGNAMRYEIDPRRGNADAGNWACVLIRSEGETVSALIR